MSDSIFILANSPGEVNGWVLPVLSALEKSNRQFSVTFVALPCPYASGMEASCVSSMSCVDRCFSFSDFLKFSFKDYAHQSKKCIVLQLGGDPFFGLIISRRVKGHWILYGKRPRYRHFVDYYFIPDKSFIRFFDEKKVSKSLYEVSGNLMIDSVVTSMSRSSVMNELGLNFNDKFIAILPGSRPFEYKVSIPFFIAMAKDIMEKFNFNIVMPLAPTVDSDIMEKVLKENDLNFTKEFPKRLSYNKGEIIMVNQHTFDIIKEAHLAIALPGTNNLQIAVLGTPLIMFAPLNEAENIPLDGIPGLIPTSSQFMKRIKRNLVFMYNRRERFLSLPNRIGQKEIVPEHRYIMTPQMASNVVCKVLSDNDKIESIVKGYKELELKHGAANVIATYIERFFSA